MAHDPVLDDLHDRQCFRGRRTGPDPTTEFDPSPVESAAVDRHAGRYAGAEADRNAVQPGRPETGNEHRLVHPDVATGPAPARRAAHQPQELGRPRADVVAAPGPADAGEAEPSGP